MPPVSQTSRYFFAPENLFYVCHVCIQYFDSLLFYISQRFDS